MNAVVTDIRPVGRALVLGDDTRGFLATVRDLGRHGIEVHAVPGNFRAPALRSRYISAVHRLPAWTGDGTAWLNAMEQLLRDVRFDVVIPCNETALLPLQRHRARFEPLTRLAIPDDESVAVLFDKHATRELARRLRIPVAPGRLLRADDTAQGLATEFGLPVVLKPRHSYRLRALHQRGKVRIAQTQNDLAALLPRLDAEETLLEGFYPGWGLGLSVLARNGVVLQTFQHHRVREMEGASYYRVSAPPDPALAAACMAIVAALGFSGVAMFEFKRGADNGWILLEVNARPWGSMPLPVALGVQFAHRWYRQLVEGIATQAVPYRAGIFARNLLPDLRAIAGEAGKRRTIPGRIGAAARRVADMWRILIGREVQDVLVADDPRPALAEFAQLAGAARERLTRLACDAGLGPALAGHMARAAWRHGGPVLFVCQGNICRSPFAAAALRRLVADPARIDSAGMLPLPGRPSPDVAQAAAARRGIDLVAHRSRLLTAADIEAASLLVVFDGINRAAVLDQFPGLQVKLLRLGDVVGAGDIADPVDGGDAEFDATYAVIQRAVEALGNSFRINSG